MKISFFVPGIPAPGGSKKAFVVAGRASIVEDCKRSGPWRDRVAMAAREAYPGGPLSGPLEVQFEFYMLRPACHFSRGKDRTRLLPSAPRHPTTKPDTTKLVRSAEDACKGILWVDDSQIVEQVARKSYGTRPGVWITVWTKEGA